MAICSFGHDSVIMLKSFEVTEALNLKMVLECTHKQFVTTVLQLFYFLNETFN